MFTVLLLYNFSGIFNTKQQQKLQITLIGEPLINMFFNKFQWLLPNSQNPISEHLSDGNMLSKTTSLQNKQEKTERAVFVQSNLINMDTEGDTESACVNKVSILSRLNTWRK